jgi:hypothetical protein
MKTLKIISAILVLALVAVGATVATAFAFGWGAQKAYNPQTAIGNLANAPQVNAPQVLAPITQTNTQTPTLYTPSYTNPQQYGGWGGCMGRWAGGAGYPTTGTTVIPLTIAQAVEVAKTYVASLNNPDLTIKQIEEYSNNFYVPVNKISTGNGAFELLVNKATGIVTPEPGPNMMWNTQYTFGAGFCNWLRGTTTAVPTVTVDQAKTDAQQYLNTYLQGTTVGDVTTFNGHYTIEVLQNGTPYGMLSVNSYSGQVWYHTWHGAFIQEQAVS